MSTLRYTDSDCHSLKIIRACEVNLIHLKLRTIAIQLNLVYMAARKA